MAELAESDDLVSLIQTTYFEHREGSLGTAIEAAAAILNAGWISPGQHAELVARNKELIAELDRLRNTPCMECGHS